MTAPINVPFRSYCFTPEYLERIKAVTGRILQKEAFILGDSAREFEARFAGYCGAPFAIGVNSGTDALFLGLKALGIGSGDEVITVANTFVATIAAIVHTGATAVLVDVREDLNIDPAAFEAAITGRTKAVIPVHLTGRPADMPAVMDIARKHGLSVLEDAAQAAGATIDGKMVGSFGIGCFSFHPFKNLYAFGDGGAITCDDPAMADAIRKLRNHGLNPSGFIETFGFNSRLDELQAAFLLDLLDRFDESLVERRQIADRYIDGLRGVVGVPEYPSGMKPAFQTVTIRAENRERLVEHLNQSGISTSIFYPKSIHRHPACELSGRVRLMGLKTTEYLESRILSLPIFNGIEEASVDHVIGTIRKFYGK